MSCCEDWDTAQKDGTDAAGYGALIRRHDLSEGDRPAFVAGTTFHVSFCPFCGDPKVPHETK